MTEKIIELCARKWVENCGISAGRRTLYWYMAWEVLAREDRDMDEVMKLIDKIDEEANSYDVIPLSSDDYREIKEFELENLSKEDKEIFLKGWEIFEPSLGDLD